MLPGVPCVTWMCGLRKFVSAAARVKTRKYTMTSANQSRLYNILVLLEIALIARAIGLFIKGKSSEFQRQSSFFDLKTAGLERRHSGQSDAEFLDNLVEPPFDTKRKPTEQDYLERYTKQVEYCGTLCSVNLTSLRRGRIRLSVQSLAEAYIQRPVRCATFFSKRAESLYDGPPLEWPPPREMPLRDKFAFNDMPVTQVYYTAKYEGGAALIPKWTVKSVEADIELLKRGELKGTYGKWTTGGFYNYTLEKVPVKGKRVIVIGTEIPWVETIMIACGAKEVTTLEYGTIESEHPLLKTVTPRQINEMFRSGTLEPYDIAVSFSSLEHSGLGRYGDMINPWGDIIWTAKISCLIKHGGLFVVNVERRDYDSIRYNGHRYYGPWRFPLLLQNWKAIDVEDKLKIVVAINQRL